ncbi:hypothetical protein EER27_11360 [Lysobacter psychrotolerans]|uniref:Uncharacterized protein n=2 Tax=Montanilutibacter psychrotolerans TaxID=1327343 RepID=A0A3M8SW79_9GAMM|nr:hypothetical protein EER27_11360 [Lysobacter psychrotolerans]
MKLCAPQWTSAGELLNADRHLFARGLGQAHKFNPPEDAAMHEYLHAFLDDAVQPTGCIYKDVVHPFAASAWLRGRRLPLLRIHRPLADVVWSMTRAGWDYPRHAAPAELAPADRPIYGLMRAWRALQSLDAVEIAFDDLLDDDSVLQRALQRLYLRCDITVPDYRDSAFRAYMEEVRLRRDSDQWRAIDARIAALEQEHFASP